MAHGNENTLKELLRIKRTVQALYNTQVSDFLSLILILESSRSSNASVLLFIFKVNMMSAQMLAAATSASGTVADLAPGAKDGMRMLEAKAAEMCVESGLYLY